MYPFENGVIVNGGNQRDRHLRSGGMDGQKVAAARFDRVSGTLC